MTVDTVQQLLFFSTASNGLLAGLNADHYIVQVPAWRRLSAAAWAEYARRADLGNGFIWYPALAITAAALSGAAAIASWRVAAPAVAEPATWGAACAAVGLGLTVFAAPNILRLRDEHDEAAETTAFRRFHAWGLARAVAQVAAFPFTLWALSAVPR
jgi:hypothetical protein